ncbi:MAG: isoprenoid biosynthesis glyoxalase ElbB [Gammaproteobacteria bacterium]|nr:isoprenoid biosynthesis glyoxalase ElbB [Gammaproteobacteria bacterium]
MMKKIAVVLAGCGQMDGSEIHEATLTLLALAQNGASYEGLAPNRDQYEVFNHYAQKPEAGTRNILVEAARIMRGNVKVLDQAKVEDYDAVIFPGGNGAAKNLFDLAIRGQDYKVEPDILKFAKAFQATGKPMGFICISPMMIPFIYPAGAKMTIGNDSATAKMAKAHGAIHVNCPVDDIVVDARYKLVSTPAYMLGPTIADVQKGIEKLVKKVLEFAYPLSLVEEVELL